VGFLPPEMYKFLCPRICRDEPKEGPVAVGRWVMARSKDISLAAKLLRKKTDKLIFMCTKTTNTVSMKEKFRAAALDTVRGVM